MNCAILRVGDRAIVLDAGVTFPDDDTLGVDLVAPDFSVLADQPFTVEAILLTHGHMDHIGSLALLLDEIDAPVFAPRYAMGIIRHQLDEYGYDPDDVELIEIDPEAAYDIGPFEATFAQVNHSIPDTFAVRLDSPVGAFVHTADFKFDTNAIYEPAIDVERLKAWGDQGVRVLFSDSTNIERPGRAGSERTVRDAFLREIKGSDARFIVTMFSTNLFRVQALIDAAYETGRKLVLLGRSLQRNVAIGRELGHIHVPAPGLMIDAEDAVDLPKSQVLIACTGSQAQPRAALARMARGGLAGLRIEPGDRVIFSARSIPGNEQSIARLKDAIVREGGRLIETRDLHVSGHGYRDDQQEMIDLLQPDVFVPVHGDHRFLRAHAALAEDRGIEQTQVLENGDVLEVTPHDARVVAQISVNRLAIDQTPFGMFFGEALRMRVRLAQRGLCIATVAIDAETGRMVEPVMLTNMGLFDREFDDGLMDDAEAVARAAVADLPKDTRRKSHRVAETMRVELIRFFRRETGRKPYVHPVVLLV